MEAKKFGLDVGWVLFSLTSSAVFTFLLRIILARWFGPYDFGLFSMIIVIHGIAVLIGNFGIQLALIKYTAEYKYDKEKLDEISSAALISSIVCGSITGIILFVFSGLISSIFNMPGLAHLCKILAILFPFSSFLESLIGLFNGLRIMKSYACLIILRSFLMILFCLVLAKLGFDVAGAVFGIVLSVIFSCLLGIKLAKKYLSINLTGFFQNTKKLFLFGIQMFGTNAINLLTNQTDILLIGYFLAETQVGYYAAAVSVTMLFLLIPHAIQRVTYPASSDYWFNNNYQALHKMIDKSMKYSACILLPLGLGIGFFAKEITILIFGLDYIYAILPLYILLIAKVFSGATIVPIGASFSGIGRPDISLKICGFQFVLNFILNVLLIPRLGIAGAALATTISLLAGNILALVLLTQIIGIRIDIKWYLQAFGFACIAIAFFFLGKNFVDSYISAISVLFGYIVFVFMLLLKREDKNLFYSFAYSLLIKK